MGVSENTGFSQFFQGINNTWGRGKIHVRHPHGQQVLIAVKFFHKVPFGRMGVSSVYDPIKIEFHLFQAPLGQVFKITMPYSIWLSHN
jgi:hypothetical protein